MNILKGGGGEAEFPRSRRLRPMWRAALMVLADTRVSEFGGEHGGKLEVTSSFLGSGADMTDFSQ